jgi:hypothetical protein
LRDLVIAGLFPMNHNLEKRMMKNTYSLQLHGIRGVLLVFCTLALGLSVNAGGTTITKFDAPGAGTDTGQGTVAFAINPAGAITGFTRDANSARHGFLRAPDGTITTFDAPGAGTCSASCGTVAPGQGTRAFAINVAGVITGFFSDNSGGCHGYVRAANGAFTQIDAPDAGTGPFPQGTFPSEISPMGINPAGAITGFYVDANSVQHGFVRAPGGKITEFDPTGSVFTTPNAIDAPGAITGFYFDANFVGHGFLRTPDGSITSFDAPGADSTPNSFNGTFGVGLTPSGEIEGVFVDAKGVLHGFVRSIQGSFTTYDVPGAGTGAGQGTLPESNNTVGVITGNSIDGNFVNHGFLVDQQGSISVFDVPGTGTGAGQGTIPLGNNDPGTIVGQYIDGGNVTHGFIVEGL